MAEKDIKRLRKSQLIDMVRQLQAREQEQAGQIAALQSQLEDRRLRMENCGSIAEAAMALNNVFAAAQQAADQYLNEVRASQAQVQQETAKMRDSVRAESDAMLLRAKAESDQVRQAADTYSQELRTRTDSEMQSKWSDFNVKLKATVEAQDSLRELLKGL